MPHIVPLESAIELAYAARLCRYFLELTDGTSYQELTLVADSIDELDKEAVELAVGVRPQS